GKLVAWKTHRYGASSRTARADRSRKSWTRVVSFSSLAAASMRASRVALVYPIHVGNGLPVRRNGPTELSGSAKRGAQDRRAIGRPPERNARSYAAAPNDRTSTRIAPGDPF